MCENIVRHNIYRGEIWLAKIENSDINNGTRPVLIISNWKNNIRSTLVNIIPLTTKYKKKEKNSLVFSFEKDKDSVILCSQITTLLKKNLIKKMTKVSDNLMNEVDILVRKQLQLEQFDIKKVKKMIISINNLKLFMTENNLQNNKELQMSIYLQKTELESYCKKYNENIKDYIFMFKGDKDYE